MLETKMDIGKTALLVIDMQNDLVKTEVEPFDAVTRMVQSKGVISNIAKTIAAARQAGIPVIFAGHVHRKDNADVVPSITDLMLEGLAPPPREAMVEGTYGADFVDELRPTPGDHVIHKRRSNAFYNSDLELILRSRGIGTVIACGVVTDGCVANTVRGARERDLHVIVLSDCCATAMPEDDEYFIKKVFPKLGRVRTSDVLIAAMAKMGR
jgi:nicotinamidase-related amidase